MVNYRPFEFAVQNRFAGAAFIIPGEPVAVKGFLACEKFTA
jgi:hypothetical protein